MQRQLIFFCCGGCGEDKRLRQHQRSKLQKSSLTFFLFLFNKSLAQKSKKWKNATSSLTRKPRISFVILDGESEEVFFKALHRIRLRLHRQSALHLHLVAVGDQVPGAPAVGTDPREIFGGIGPPDSAHHACHFLVGAEDNHTWNKRLLLSNAVLQCGDENRLIAPSARESYNKPKKYLAKMECSHKLIIS